MKPLLLATSNPGKVRELRRLLRDCGFSIVTPSDLSLNLEVAEDGATYEANATAKATAFARASGLWTIADDSGLEVDALDGRPGLHSARYGGPGLDDRGRNALLLGELADLPDERRTARYRAVVAVAGPDGTVRTFEGVQEGSIGRACRGSGGFGYDPVFVIDDGRTQAELPPADKDRVSHRGRATRLAAAFLGGIA